MDTHAEDALEFEQTPCPLCGEDCWKPVVTGRDNLFDLPGEFHLVRCTKCRHAYLNPRPTLETIGLCYPAEYGPYRDDRHSEIEQKEPGSTTDAIGTPWYLTAWARRIPGLRRLYYWLADSKSQIIPHVDSVPKRALEIGCAHGRFLSQLRDEGWEATGVEPADAPAQLAAKRGFPVHVGTLESATFSDNSFDAVFAWQVIEHLHDPMSTLGEICHVLKPRGWLAFAVPNFGCWERRFFGQSWHALELPRHLQHFTPRTLRWMLNEQGFEVVRIVHQRNLLNVTGSIGIVLNRWFPVSRPGERLIRFTEQPTMWRQLAMAPLAKFLALIHQGGKLPVIARRREHPLSTTKPLP